MDEVLKEILDTLRSDLQRCHQEDRALWAELSGLRKQIMTAAFSALVALIVLLFNLVRRSIAP